MENTILKKIINLTKDHPYYQNYNFNHWTSLPVMNKEEVLRNHSKITCHTESFPRLVTRTSGSSGIILSVPWALKDYLFLLKQLWNQRKKYGVSVQDPYVTCHANYYLGSKQLIENKIVVNKNCHSISKVHMTIEDMTDYMKYIVAINPSWMLLQPSIAYAWGLFAEKNNVKIKNLKLIELTGEKVSLDLIKSIKRCFGEITIVNHYGTQEFQGISYGLAENPYLECLNDNVYVEILDSNNNPVKDGEDGRVIVTGLSNRIFPLIRYETGDVGSIIRTDNKTLLYVKESRSNDTLIFNGKRFDGSLFFNVIEHLNCRGYNIVQFQFFYDGTTLTALLYSYDNTYSSRETVLALKDILQSMYGISMQSIVVNWVSEFIKPEKSNKYKYFTATHA